jgi:hypothetical protein
METQQDMKNIMQTPQVKDESLHRAQKHPGLAAPRSQVWMDALAHTLGKSCALTASSSSAAPPSPLAAP